MSHFTVMVAIPPERTEEGDIDIDNEVARMLAPYQENNMGDCPEEYMEFVSIEEEYLERYETETWTGFIKEQRNGKRRFVFEMGDDLRKTASKITNRLRKELKKDGFWGIGYPVPPEVQDEVDQEMRNKGWRKATIPMKERYPTFEGYMADFCGHKKRDERHGVFGYYENPDCQWDWWVIGGRWRGMLRLKEGVQPIFGRRSAFDDGKAPDDPHTSDVARGKDIDFEGIESETEGKVEKFWSDLSECLERGKDSPDEGEDFNVRWRLIDVGVVTGQEPMLTYVNGLTLEKLKTEYREHFCFATYAVLDENGWRAPGKMGWWGCSSATPEGKKEHKGSFLDWMRSKPEDTIFVVVDCHI